MKRSKKASSFEAVYLKRLAFNERPFDAGFDRALFFASRSHADGLKALDAFIGQKKGIALTYGEEGTGKTFVRMFFLDGLDRSRHEVGLVSGPAASGADFLAEVARRFDVTLPAGSTGEMAEALGRCLVSRLPGKIPVLAVDDAETLSDDALDVLFGLFREDRGTFGQPLRVLLFGRNDLVTRLLDRRMEHVRRHIATTHCIQPLLAEEVGPYVMHRLEKAGSNNLVRFTRDALDRLYAGSGGYPRAVDSICDRCLFLLQERFRTVVDKKTMDRALKSEDPAFTAGKDGSPALRPSPAVGSRSKVFLALACGVAAALVVLGAWLLRLWPFSGH